MITVLIPSFNHAHHLPFQLASVIRQGSSVSKIIVVNDGSTDDTANILAKFQLDEPRLMAINLPQNIGLQEALQVGMRFINTEFFAFAAADDILMPNWAEKSLSPLLSSTKVGLCLSSTFVANETSDTLKKTIFPLNVRGMVLMPQEFHRSIIKYGTWFTSNTTLYRRSAFDDAFFSQMKSIGPAFFDGLSIYFLGLKTGVAVVDEPLGVFFVNESSISSSANSALVGIDYLQELSITLTRPPFADTIDRQLAVKLLRRNTYIYLIGAVHLITTKFTQFAHDYLPFAASKALHFSLWILSFLFRLFAFISLRPFDLVGALKIYSHSATAEEKNVIRKYRKTLNESFQSIDKNLI